LNAFLAFDKLPKAIDELPNSAGDMPKAVTDWKTIKLPEIRALARPLFLRSQVLPARCAFPMHRHKWHQLAYAISGTLSVAVEESWHVVTPDQAIWIPKGVMHTTTTSTGAEFRSLYIAAGRNLSMPRTSTVFDVTPLFKALILELASFGKRREDDVYISQVERLTLSQLCRLSPQDFSLPWPRSKSLQQICGVLFASPGDKRDIDHWAAEVGASVRTFERRFEDELGLTFRVWRCRLRLFKSVEWLGIKRSMTDIAFDLGYASPSAFAYMFRMETGYTPSQWQKRSPDQG